MTVTYSLDVANTRFCGFTKLLRRWKGSIYKILWKEFLCFCAGYAALSLTYRYWLNEAQKGKFENVVQYCEAFIDLIPLSFVLGFYVSLVMGRWWNQFDVIPWPDQTSFLIATFVHGADERSRTIRRTLGRYLILMQAFTFQAVSTAVKKRFPTVDHLQAAGLITEEERTLYEKVHVPYGKWWLPGQWFCALAMRAKKEGRIKDSVLLKAMMKEMIKFRNKCGDMFSYDWISVPLVYTQVVTLATYTYSLALLIGRQYLDPERGFQNHKVDMYVPVFTLLQFFFYVGWLKVAEQIVNPYGEDDDDFELNWCIDRSAQVAYLLVDHLHTKHPKLRKDQFWDEFEPQLPHTKFSAHNLINPQLGSAAHLQINPNDAKFLPMETLLEEDNDDNVCDSIKESRHIRYRPSILMNMLNGGLGQSFRRHSTSKGESFRDASSIRGHTNPAFAFDMQNPGKGSTPSHSRKSSVTKAPSPGNSRASSVSFRKGSSFNRSKRKMYDFHQAEVPGSYSKSTVLPDDDFGNSVSAVSVTRSTSASACSEDTARMTESTSFEKIPSAKEHLTSECETSTPKTTDSYLQPIPEEPSRVPSMANLDSADSNCKRTSDEVHDLVVEAGKVLQELNRAVSKHGHTKECALVGYESCCSLSSDDESSDEDLGFQSQNTTTTEFAQDELSVVIDGRMNEEELIDPTFGPSDAL